MPDVVREVVAAALDRRTAEQALHGKVVGDLEVEDCRELAAVDLGQDLVERLRLRERPREPVQDEAVRGVVLVEAYAHDLDRQLVRDEVAGVEDRLDALAELGAGAHSARNISPVLMCGIPASAEMSLP